VAEYVKVFRFLADVLTPEKTMGLRPAEVAVARLALMPGNSQADRQTGAENAPIWKLNYGFLICATEKKTRGARR
jgi:hypothetical protein